MKVSIEYCSMWNYLPQASSLEAQLEKEFKNIDITLISSGGGVFEVMFGEKIVFSKKLLKRFPNDGEIITLINGL